MTKNNSLPQNTDNHFLNWNIQHICNQMSWNPYNEEYSPEWSSINAYICNKNLDSFTYCLRNH